MPIGVVLANLVRPCTPIVRTTLTLHSPVASSTLRRRYVQVVSAICILSFLVTQVSLLSWCQPTHIQSDIQCQTYHNHSIISLTFSALTTVLVLILPTPSIPTPRRLLLGILIILAIMALVAGILARYFILTLPNSPSYLFYYTSESTLLIVFANLPFLTSLVVSTAPARIREFGRNLSFSRDGGGVPLSPWPRSRRTSIQCLGVPPLGRIRLGSTATIMSGGTERKEWAISQPCTPVIQPESEKRRSKILWVEGRLKSGRDWPLP